MTTGITGATGFLGSHLLRELLGNGDEPITALVRPKARRPSRDRLMSALAAAGADTALLARADDLVTVVEGDVGKPRLGLDPTAYRRLADSLDTVWHSAALVALTGPRDPFTAQNVVGTQAVLDLAEAGARRPRVHHVSTAYVAGGRRDGTVFEDELDDSAGFENYYEASKYEAELLVRSWARRHHRPVSVYRPSLLLTDQPIPAGAPGHTFATLARIASPFLGDGPVAPSPLLTAADTYLSSTPESSTSLPLPLPGRANGTINCLPVEHAVRMMLAVAARPPANLVDTYHLVSPHETANTDLLAAIAHHLPRMTLTFGSPPAAPSPVQRLFYDVVSPFLSFFRHDRRYDRRHLGEATKGVADPAPPDAAYLRSAVGSYLYHR
ncbi:SDR family oxidoreductase [Saccharothrix sp. Mg75]|uniref:SDR family oxidoreductase n=1 Tax=Saccharothrix sp. Mg75 TaxID=3445357 RepID=UPI003EEE155F